jgi:hypothetical protein
VVADSCRTRDSRFLDLRAHRWGGRSGLARTFGSSERVPGRLYRSGRLSGLMRAASRPGRRTCAAGLRVDARFGVSADWHPMPGSSGPSLGREVRARSYLRFERAGAWTALQIRPLERPHAGRLAARAAHVRRRSAL